MVFDKPLSQDYIADRVMIDDPLCGYMIRTERSGWLQGFIIRTTFTTWQVQARAGCHDVAGRLLPCTVRPPTTNHQPCFYCATPRTPCLQVNFRWDSNHAKAGLTRAARREHLCDDGALSTALEAQRRSGDPSESGIVWPRIAEISLLAALGCGGVLVKLLIEELESASSGKGQYDFLVLQATKGAMTS